MARWFIAFSFVTSRGDTGDGHVDMDLDKITSDKDIIAIETRLKKENKFKHVVIHNFRKYEV